MTELLKLIERYRRSPPDISLASWIFDFDAEDWSEDFEVSAIVIRSQRNGAIDVVLR